MTIGRRSQPSIGSWHDVPMRWLLFALCLFGCKRRDEKLSPDRRTYAFADHEGTSRVSELYLRASALMDKNDLAGARQLYQQAVDAEPDKPMGYIGLGSCALRERKYEQARRLYELAATLDARSSSARVGLGSVAALEDHQREAVGFFEKALEIDEHNPDAHWGAAIAYQALGENDRMRAHARRFLELAPNSMLAGEAAKMLLP
jgi:tetratricopeptide (TPR) repeat protein